MQRGRRPNPWWIPPFLGSVPDIEDRHLRLLGVVALALLFEEYDLGMLTSALKFIAADLRMAETDLGYYLGMIRLGALPALFVIPFADRVGRRRVFLISVAGTGVLTAMTAFSQTPMQFVLLQMFTRTFFIAGSAVAFVVITEEFPAGHRGWGIGMLGALGSCGHGLQALFFSQINHLPYGWRSLYMVGLVPVLLLPFFRRRLQETARFRAHQADRNAQEQAAGIRDMFRPLIELARTFPGRALGITVVGALGAFGMVAAFQFTGLFTQTVHGWSPGEYALMFVVGGGIGIIGNIVAGRLGDRFGRRRVGFSVLAACPVFVSMFYLGPGWTVPIAWVGFVFCSSAGRTIVRTFATELFPTSQRGTSSGWWALVDALSAAAGLLLLGLAASEPGDIQRITPLLSIAVFVGGSVLLLFPETRQRELESISEVREAGQVAS